MRKRRSKVIECIEYLSVEAVLDHVNRLEDKQSKYIRENIRNKNYKIVGTMRRKGFSQRDVNRQWEQIVALIKGKKVQGVVVADIRLLSTDDVDAYKKIGQIVTAGGVVYAVNAGNLRMVI